MRYELRCHPAMPTAGIERIYVDVSTLKGYPRERSVCFYVHSIEPIVLPPQDSSVRTDGLWRTTCLEVFLKPANGSAYFEYNFSPSTAWAAYSFADYRQGQADLAVQFEPEIETWERQMASQIFDIDFDISFVGTLPVALGLSAVIEEQDGTKSYWALAHAPGPPDFHNPACFTATLPAPDGP